jgi:hypothetical protein
MGRTVAALLARCITPVVSALARIGVRRNDRSADSENRLVPAIERVAGGTDPTWLPDDDWARLLPSRDRAPSAVTRLTYQQRGRLADVARAWGMDERELSSEASEALARFVLGETSREECRARLAALGDQ